MSLSRCGVRSAAAGVGQRLPGPAEIGRRPYRGAVEFSRELREAVVAGEITLSFRLWQRPQVRAGGRYSVGPAVIEVESIELVPFSTVTRQDLDRAGETDLESLRRRTAHAGPVHDDTLVYRIEFHVV
jgi:hypothetical protein